MNCSDDNLVYSTDPAKKGVLYTRSGRSSFNSSKSSKRAVPPKDGFVRVSRETKGRKGKGVTLVQGLDVSEAELKRLGTLFKQQCGSGGTVKDGVIEIQGDVRDRLVRELEHLGYKVKRSGA